MKIIEMAILWDDFTWTDGHLVTIPSNTPRALVESVGKLRLLEESHLHKGYIMAILYNDSLTEEELVGALHKKDCIVTGRHLNSCDRDGFCNMCGEQ